MATVEEYAQWIVNNSDKKGTPEFDIVAKAYQEAKQTVTPPKEQGGFFSSFKNAATKLGDTAATARFVAASGKPEEAAARKALIEAQQPDYATTSFSDIKNPMDAFNWARQSAGE